MHASRLKARTHGHAAAQPALSNESAEGRAAARPLTHLLTSCAPRLRRRARRLVPICAIRDRLLLGALCAAAAAGLLGADDEAAGAAAGRACEGGRSGAERCVMRAVQRQRVRLLGRAACASCRPRARPSRAAACRPTCSKPRPAQGRLHAAGARRFCGLEGTRARLREQNWSHSVSIAHIGNLWESVLGARVTGVTPGPRSPLPAALPSFLVRDEAHTQV